MPANIRHRHTIKNHAKFDGNLTILRDVFVDPRCGSPISQVGRECKTDLPARAVVSGHRVQIADHREEVLVKREWAGRNPIRGGGGARAEQLFHRQLARPDLDRVILVSLASVSCRISVGLVSFSVGFVSG